MLYSCALLAGALILQYGFGLHPCPLCIMARGVVIALLILYLLASIICSPQRTCRGVGIVGLLLTLAGIAVTARHVWILHLPPELVPDCSPSFNYLMKTFPLNQALMIMFKSSGECAGQHGTFLGVTLPGWTLLAFVGYFFANIWATILSFKRRV